MKTRDELMKVREAIKQHVGSVFITNPYLNQALEILDIIISTMGEQPAAQEVSGEQPDVASEISYNNMQPGEFLQAVGMDGKLWTDAFMEMWGNRLSKVDHGLMLGWFCNAIMAGYDEATRRDNKPVSVSLEKCAKGVRAASCIIGNDYCERLCESNPCACAVNYSKAVLDAAGVKYHE